MSDLTTTLNSGVGGNVVKGENIGGQVMPYSKIRTGAEGTDGGDVTAWNRFPVNAFLDRSHLGPFGDLIAEPKTPIFQLDFVYGIFTQTGTTSTSGVGASVDTNAGRLRVQNGTGAAGDAYFTTVRPARYRPGQGVIARFTAVFLTSAASSSQIVGMGGNNAGGAIVDGYFFGFNGTAFGIAHYNNSTSPTWTAQASWNVDTCDGNGTSGFNLDPTKGNVYVISYPYLGYGDIFFYVEDSTTGILIHCHTIRYANSSTSTQLGNPSMSFFARATSTGSTTNLTIYVGSISAFLVGMRIFTGDQFGIDNNKATITTETNILSLRNATTFNGVLHRGLIRLRSVSFSSDSGNGVAVLRIKQGVTLGGAPSYTAISGTTADSGVTLTNAQSMASFDVAGTTITGGVTLFNATAARNTGYQIDLTPYDFFIPPATTWTFSMFCSASSTATVAVNWYEDK